MDVIRLNDILRFSEEQISRTKIRLNKNNGVENPIDVFKRDPAKLLDWNYWNSKNIKKTKYQSVLSIWETVGICFLRLEL